MPGAVVWTSLLLPAGPSSLHTAVLSTATQGQRQMVRCEKRGGVSAVVWWKDDRWKDDRRWGMTAWRRREWGGLGTTDGASGASYNVNIHGFTPLCMVCHADGHCS